MKTYQITIQVPNRMINDYRDKIIDAVEEGNFEALPKLAKILFNLNSWENEMVEVSTLEEYFELLKKISECSNDEFVVSDCGQWVEIVY